MELPIADVSARIHNSIVKQVVACAVFAALCAVGCRNSAAPAATPTNVTFVDPLRGTMETNKTLLLEEIRHLPKRAALDRRVFTNDDGSQLRYWLFKPQTTGTNLPLVLSLHGAAPRRQFEHMLEPGLPGLAYGLGRLISNDTQQKHPSFVVAPWSNGRSWDDAHLTSILALLDALAREFPIDTNRIYVTGQSMGGWGTWSILARAPERFAAAVPICGGGNPQDAARITNVPIWAFHGSADSAVPVARTREMIAAIEAAGGQPRYWEYVNETHAGTAERAYCEPDLIEWLFAQRRR